MNAIKLLSMEIGEERKKKRPDYQALCDRHLGWLERVIQSEADDPTRASATRLRNKLVLNQSIPLTHFPISDKRDSYTGEPFDKLCSLECDNLMGDADTHFCMTGCTCELGEVCPWSHDADPHVTVGTTWLNLPMPAMVQGIATSDIEEEWMDNLGIATDSLLSEDDTTEWLCEHWSQSFDGQEELAEFTAEHQQEYATIYERMRGDDPPWEKVDDIFPTLEYLLDSAVSEFIEGNLGEVTLSVIFFRLTNGLTLNYQGIGTQAEEAKRLRTKYRQWLNMTADNQHLIPDGDQAPDWATEDPRHVQAWIDLLEAQEAKAYGKDWIPEKAYRDAACHGGPSDARAAAREARGASNWLEELAERI